MKRAILGALQLALLLGGDAAAAAEEAAREGCVASYCATDAI